MPQDGLTCSAGPCLWACCLRSSVGGHYNSHEAPDLVVRLACLRQSAVLIILTVRYDSPV